METYHDLAKLTADIGGWHVRAKVIRIFSPQPPANAGLGLILSDEKGQRIECSISSQLVEHYGKYLEEADWISLLIFRVGENTDAIRATNHRYKILFYDITVVKKVDPPLMEPCRTFAPFSSIYDETVNTSILLDLIGVMFDVGELRLKGSDATNIADLRIKFSICGLCTDVLKCKAYGRTVREIHENYLPYNGRPLVVILQMWKVNRWFSGWKNVRIENHGRISKILPEPDIPEAKELQYMLSWCDDAVCWAY